jgi:S-adenosylmethionine hydrolase
MIVLMTDFGESEYVGVMRGVIYSVSPTAQIADLTHSIPAQSVRVGAWILLNSYKHFPKRSTFVCVVDPGVGTGRDAVIVDTRNYVFVGPDNGLMYPAATEDGIRGVRRIHIPDTASHTFHGRDVFARVGGLLDAGVKGSIRAEPKPALDVPLSFYQEGREGEVVRIDRFGNIITNIPPLEKQSYILKAGKVKRDLEFRVTYEQGPEDDVFLVVGSYGTLEIAARGSSARERITLDIGERVALE